MNTIEIEKETLKKEQPIDFIKLVESNYLKSEFNLNNKIEIGDIIRLGYLIPEGGKDRTQYYEG